jgi:hypothetical protein
MDSDKRNLTRVAYSAHALIKSTKKKQTVKAIVRDVSLESMYLYCERKPFIGEIVNIEITLLGLDSELIIKVSGKVQRLDGQGVVITFFKPLEWWPIFTYFPLKKLDGAATNIFRVEQFR